MVSAPGTVVRNCQSCKDMSFMIVKPAIAAPTSASPARRTSAQMTTINSTSRSSAAVSAGLVMSSRAPRRESANFTNSVGYAGNSRSISLMWFVW
ncbi:Uncharacterised protein [Mycobacteroides abscessus subsp. abscessus]|nr:Uncharacterised protein [Mycobacteroides abscessus subsp. abscessus]